MKDYYSRLNLPITATQRAIETELPALGDSALRRNARFVLLDPERRAVYDHYHRALHQIAFLRANLGLNRAPFWQLSDCDDFSTEPFDRRRRKKRASRVKPLLGLLLMLLAMWGFLERLTPSASFEIPEQAKQAPGHELPRTDVVEPNQELPPVQSKATWQDWYTTFETEVAPIEQAWKSLTSGLDQRSFELAESRCRRLQKAVQRCDRDRILPSPDLELDAPIHQFLEHLAIAAQTCRSQRYFQMTEELDRAQEGWDRIERKLRYQALGPQQPD